MTIASVRPRRRKVRRIVLLHWVVPVFASEATVLVLIILFGRLEYRLPSTLALTAIVAWHVLYVVSALIEERARSRRFRDLSRSVRSRVASGEISANEGRLSMGLPPSSDSWAHVRERDD
jgi:hypothetical protein